MIKALDHAHVMCGNVEEVAKFFKNVLDAREIARGDIRGMAVIRVDVKGVVVILHTTDPKASQFETGKGIRGLDHIGFLVDDIEKTVAEMKGKGGRFSQEVKTTGGGAKFTFLEGPEGMRFELMEK